MTDQPDPLQDILETFEEARVVVRKAWLEYRAATLRSALSQIQGGLRPQLEAELRDVEFKLGSLACGDIDPEIALRVAGELARIGDP